MYHFVGLLYVTDYLNSHTIQIQKLESGIGTFKAYSVLNHLFKEFTNEPPPHPIIKDIHVFLSLVEKKLKFFRNTLQDFYI